MSSYKLDRHILFRHRDVPNIREIDVFLADQGYQGLKKAIKEMKPSEVIDQVKAAGLRGRGGAGFPTGLKWSFIPQNISPKYIVVNGDESEPGTFKDREIMEYNPHLFIEGIALCAYAVGAATAYVYGRGEFLSTFRYLQNAINQAYQKGFLGKNILGSDFSLDIHLHLGAGAYICGEETALLNSLEGYMGQPRNRPPFPAVAGLYAKPTVINNVETLTGVPYIIQHGVEAYRKYGTEKSPGTKIISLSGRVNKPGNYEINIGTPVRYLLEELGGGIIGGKKVKAILPSGAASSILPGDKIDTLMDYESMAAAGSMLGSGSFIVLDETVDAVWAEKKVIDFFKHESCGKCSPCREGTHWLKSIFTKITEGHGTKKDVDLLTTIINQMEGNCFCPLGEFVVPGVRTSLKFFRSEYDSRVVDEPANGAPVHLHL